MKTPEEIRSYRAEWRRKDRAANPEKYASIKKQYYERNRDRVLKSVKSYQTKNAELIAARKALRYASSDKIAKKDYNLRRLYGIGIERYDEMLWSKMVNALSVLGIENSLWIIVMQRGM